MSHNLTAICLDCNKIYPYHPLVMDCPRCGSNWSEARYDYSTIGKDLPIALQRHSFDMWRYHELLPVKQYNPNISMGEGGTPLIHAGNLGMMLGCPNLYIKDERQGPTSSFKDRQAAVAISSLKEAGITEAVLASTGNVAIAYSAYAARAGIKLWAFLTSLVPSEKMREVALYGTQVVKVTGSYDEAKRVAAEFAHHKGLCLERGARTIPSVEAMKTIAFEIAEQLEKIHQSTDPSMPDQAVKFFTPDWYIQAVSGGLGPLGVLKGFKELQMMKLISHVPAIANIQAEGCAPMVHAWRLGSVVAEPVNSPRTHIATLATGDPGRTYTLLSERMRESSGGIFESVTDEETFRTIHMLAKMEGISVEPAAAVAFAGLIKLVRSGVIKSSDVIVVNCTGHTMPVEKLILGDSWSRKIVLPSTSLESTPEEGLLSALNKISADRFPRILIVDDMPDARRLIRRILNSQGEYIISEASNGREAIDQISIEPPDLVILDLMMPDVDGFGVIDALKSDTQTSTIPIIVVTAKELSAAEKQRLPDQIHSLMQKGEFLSDEFMDEIRCLVK